MLMIPLRKASYDDRDVLKNKGAKWNALDKFWYVPDGKDPVVFREYMDDLTQSVCDAFVSHYESLREKDLESRIVEVSTMDEFLARSKYIKPDDFVVIDTETTGLGLNDEVVELSVLDSKANELYHSFFKPGVRMNSMATQVSGIADEHLNGAPMFVSEWNKILSIIGGRRVAGHNLGFDRRLMQQTLEKQTGVDCSQVFDKMFDNAIDSWRLAQQSNVGKGKRSLGQLCDAMGVKSSPNHRTSYDCLGVLYVLQNFELHDYGVKKSVRRLPDVDYSGCNSRQLSMNFQQ